MIRRKLALGFALELALVGAVAAVGMFGLNSVRRSFRSAIDGGLAVQQLAEEMKSELALARRAEKDFLLQWQAEGVEPALKFVAENRRHVQRLRGLAAELGQREGLGLGTAIYPPKRSVEDLIALVPYINVYAEDFEAAVELIKLQHQRSSPLQDRFRELATELLARLREPRTLQAVTSTFVDMRQAERDYLWRGQRSAAEQVLRSATKLQGQLAALPATTRNRAETLRIRYLEAFESVASVETQVWSKISDFNAAAVVVGPLVDDIAAIGRRGGAAAVAAAETASGRTRLFVSLSVIAALLTGLTLASLLGRQITTPLTDLAQAAQAIGAGDLDARAQEKSRDELGMLARAFNAMTTQVRGLVRSLEERVRERQDAEAEVRRLNAELEDRVRARTQELQTANEELEAFLYSVSHDLRTPLRHMAGFLYLLRQSEFKDEDRAHMAVIDAAVKRMWSLIDALLAFSQAGRAAITLAAVDLNKLVEEVRTELVEETQSRNICWKVAGLPTVRADRVLLRQVMTNLLSNAVKFSRPREVAEIEIREAPEEARDNERVILVRDNGVGFDMAYVKKLFGVFKRLHGPEEFPGTGIGLANVHRIVSRLGGRVWAVATVNGGASFYVALPASRESFAQA